MMMNFLSFSFELSFSLNDRFDSCSTTLAMTVINCSLFRYLPVSSEKSGLAFGALLANKDWLDYLDMMDKLY